LITQTSNQITLDSTYFYYENDILSKTLQRVYTPTDIINTELKYNQFTSTFASGTYKVFKDHFVVCWAGIKKVVDSKTVYSRVDIELINEQIRLFYSALDEVEIEYNSQSFIITEYVQLGIDKDHTYYPLEKTVINFKDNGIYDIATELLFEPPVYDQIVLQHIYNSNNAIIDKLEKKLPLNKNDKLDLEQLPTSYLICSLNGFKEARDKLELAQPFLKNLSDKTAYINLKEAKRVLRKVTYSI